MPRRETGRELSSEVEGKREESGTHDCMTQTSQGHIFFVFCFFLPPTGLTLPSLRAELKGIGIGQQGHRATLELAQKEGWKEAAGERGGKLGP